MSFPLNMVLEIYCFNEYPCVQPLGWVVAGNLARGSPYVILSTHIDCHLGVLDYILWYHCEP